MLIVIFPGGLFFILSIILLSGKGSMLISGYNTASKEEKEKYDKEKLSRAAGVMLLLITIAYILMAYFNSLYSIITFLFFVGIAIAVTTVYVRKKCQKTIFEEKKIVSPFQIIIGICFTVFLVLLVSIPLYFYSRPPVYYINDSTFSISTEYGETINISDIKRLQLKNNLPQGLKKVVGINLGTILKGNFTSKNGDLTVYINTAHPPFIYLSTTTGLIIINDQTKTDTQSLFNRLETKIKQ
ncbi:DUF3784 domain-containing protein [Desulfosporosinus sp. FKA]|uniref:DUF3784 domain-containing protein n=1 Tax=Desulfosporosinus sp. FKA TaxID=1969834 RepID=UPI000B499AA2|nr:DUF3784 domain-containing protein [Desulfosporosinus sp. FKA]